MVCEVEFKLRQRSEVGVVFYFSFESPGPAMKLPMIAMFILILLMGCDKERSPDSDKAGRYATLYFDKPVNQLYMEPGRAAFTLYPDNVIESLRGLGVQVEGLDFQLDKKQSSIIHIAIKDESFGPDQQQALKHALQDVLEAKRMPAFSGHVIMDPESSDFKVGQPQLYERSDNGVYIHPQSELTIQVRYKKDFKIYYGKPEFYCYVVSRIKHDLPFEMAVLMPGDRGTFLNMAVMTWSQKYKRVAVNFNSADMRRLLSEGKLELGVKSLSLSGQMAEVSVLAGSLGTHSYGLYEHKALTTLSSDLYDELTSKCQLMVTKLGRPFTFQFGDGLDRLRDVVYTEQPAT
jgi:hypothetical protein